MDVHHHSHSGRKSFRHYLFEFFMLFLAVFCGFIAEYFLEHTIEHQREKQFIESMITDLKDDTARINKVYTGDAKRLKGLDTLLTLLYSNPAHPDSVKKVYRYYIRHALSYDRVVFNNRTLTQLKNSGGMRLIRIQSVSDSIMNYDANVQNAELQFEVEKDTWKEQSNFSFQIFDLSAVVFRKSAPAYTPKLMTNDPRIMAGYANRLAIFSGTIIGYMQDIAAVKAAAGRLIKHLENKYHLE